MSEMQLIMENWRTFGERDKLIESHEYITKVLGIAIPLNESYPFSAKLSEQILQEQLLLEGFFDDAVNKVKQGAQKLGNKAREAIQDGTAWVKQFGENVGRLMHSLWIIFRNPSMVGEYISSLEERMNIRRLGELDQFVENVATLLAPTKLAAIGTKVKEMWTSVKSQYESMASSWKKALVGSTLMVMLQYILSKLTTIISTVNNLMDSGVEELTDAAREEIGEEIKTKVFEYFEENLGSIFQKLGEYSSGVGVWVDWISKMVGGVDYVAKNLFGTTRGFLQKAQAAAK
jgi:hypothetical protein